MKTEPIVFTTNLLLIQVFLERQFRKNNLQLVYDSTDGKYTVTDETLPDARVELIVFEEDPMVREQSFKYSFIPI